MGQTSDSPVRGSVEVPGIERALATVGAPGAAGSVIVVPGVHGATPHIGAVMHRLGGQGFTAVLADWFCPDPPEGLTGPDAIADAVRGIDDDATASGLATAAERLRADGPVAVLGYCVGATMALLAATRTDAIRGVVAYYGVLRYRGPLAGKGTDPMEAMKGVRHPVLGHYGRADGWIPDGDVDELEAALASSGVPNELYRYPGAGHAFDELGRPGYRPVASADAARRTSTFLEHHLGVER